MPTDFAEETSLVTRFEACTLPSAELGHRQHVQIAWVYLRQASFEEAALRFCTNLRRYAEAIGKGGLYHATITWAYLVLVNERIHAEPSGDFGAFAERNPDLFDHKTGALAARYDKAVLDSPLARSIFLLPERR
jgi:hypothetical protein